jgi:hypothetical protein
MKCTLSFSDSGLGLRPARLFFSGLSDMRGPRLSVRCVAVSTLNRRKLCVYRYQRGYRFFVSSLSSVPSGSSLSLPSSG